MRKRNESGLTIVEIMFSVAILSVGLTATLAVVTGGAQYSEVARRLQVATEAAETRIDWTVANGAADVADVGSISPTAETNIDSLSPLPPFPTYNDVDSATDGATGMTYLIASTLDRSTYGGTAFPTGPDFYTLETTDVLSFNQGTVGGDGRTGILRGLPNYNGSNTRSDLTAYPISINPNVYVVASRIQFPYHFLPATGGGQGVVRRVTKMSLVFTGGAGMSVGGGDTLIENGSGGGIGTREVPSNIYSP